VNQKDREQAIAALESARNRLEAALRGEPARPRPEPAGLMGGPGGLAEARHESDVRKASRLVTEAIELLRPGGEARDEAVANPDDLTFIRGIDPALAQHLASLGITRFADIAAWRPDDVRNVSEALGLTREISRQNWIEQAALLQRRKDDVGAKVPDARLVERPEERTQSAAAHSGQPEASASLTELLKEVHLRGGHPGDAPSAFALELASQTLNAQVDAPLPAAPAGREDMQSRRPGDGDTQAASLASMAGPQSSPASMTAGRDQPVPAARSPRQPSLVQRLVKAVTGG
jgi:predicted flap endonuclease-1-like 5' DNA nuclease